MNRSQSTGFLAEVQVGPLTPET